jgi:hypothetical protein
MSFLEINLPWSLKNLIFIFIFKVDVIGYKASQMDKNVIFYIIEVEKRGHEKWTVDKRFSEFYGKIR